MNTVLLFSCFVLSYLALKKGGGSIVTISAKAALQPDVAATLHTQPTKLLLNLTLQAAREGRKENVRANVIVPGVIDTPANRSWGSADQIAKWTTPEDIASCICWLMSDASAGVNGTVIPMYGQLWITGLSSSKDANRHTYEGPPSFCDEQHILLQLFAIGRIQVVQAGHRLLNTRSSTGITSPFPGRTSAASLPSIFPLP